MSDGVKPVMRNEYRKRNDDDSNVHQWQLAEVATDDIACGLNQGYVPSLAFASNV